MDLYIVRHGKAGKSTSDLLEDNARRLTKKGRAEMRMIAGWLKKADISWDVIASSPLPRAWETAEIIAAEQDPHPPVEAWECLATGGNRQDLRKNLIDCRDCSSVLIVGHEPMLSDLVGNLTAVSSNASVVLGKGSVAKVRNVNAEGVFSGTLEWLIPAYIITEM
jgi:phosphohistidine phosphatase